MKNIEWAARIAWGEARGEGAAGMHAVINVMQNRAETEGRFGNSLAEVSTRPRQFSAFNKDDPSTPFVDEGDPNRELLLNVTDDDPEFRIAVALATQAVDGKLPDLTNGADHYHARNIALPSWVRNSPNATVSAIIGNHIFYTGIE
ncbi:cell wall hydrolase [Kordiimonas sp. SCSIO 12610]|uniref:cell wall hydrolase n=1 Tax=Kordiimonas sp. SCSIO 12610 TaxID=2829597 RepID=UPI00210B0A93|nr:cell wall hydrolase [Kordiimonas sp. SCSIO 12610]UTW53969.1 cell wall hydrolase [Kordiimonas sp. SCSIO 12610]